jgi:hypothetical protein
MLLKTNDFKSFVFECFDFVFSCFYFSFFYIFFLILQDTKDFQQGVGGGVHSQGVTLWKSRLSPLFSRRFSRFKRAKTYPKHIPHMVRPFTFHGPRVFLQTLSGKRPKKVENVTNILKTETF